MAFSHNSKVSDSEPDWGSVDKSALPQNAFADEGHSKKPGSWKYPHHWVQNGGGKDENGIYTTGTMYLHEGGLNAAWSAANGARSGQEASQAVKDHLQTHRKALGLDNKTARHPISAELLSGREYLGGQQISSIDPENRTVDVIFFTGADVARMNPWTGDKYILRFDPNGSDLSLLNNDAPVLDTHSLSEGTASQKGKVERAWRENGNWMARLRFSKRSSVDDLWNDIQDRIITKLSMGVEILEAENLSGKDQPLKLAKKWRPFELSVLPIPADFGTTTLAAAAGAIFQNTVNFEIERERLRLLSL